MSLDVNPFSEVNRKVWDEFVWGANNGTLFHTRQFLDYHPPDRFVDRSLLFCKGERIVAVLPAVEWHEKGAKSLLSHRGASYGGPVVRDDLSVREAFDLVRALLLWARDNRYDSIDLTLVPQIYYRRPSNYIDFALIQNGFSYRKREISSVIPLNMDRREILNTFRESSRRAVRRAYKLGVKVQESTRYDLFYQILKKNLRLRHNVTPTHTLEELDVLRRLFPERIKLFAAEHHGRMAAGVVIFICNPQVVLAFYISHDEAMQNVRGVNALFHAIIDWGITSGFLYLDFGIFTVNEDPNWGLARFKESFGAQGVFRDSLRCAL